MRFMRRLTATVALLSLLYLAGCSNGAPVADAQKAADDGRLSVVATLFAPYDFARQVAGDTADVTMLLPPGSESHSYDPTPQDILRIQNCDIFLCVGGESDAWVDRILDSMDTSRMQVVRLMECVEAVEETIVEGMQAEDEHGHEGADEHDADEHANDEHDADEHANDEHDANARGETPAQAEEPEYDEHVWTAPRNVMAIVGRIADAVAAADPALGADAQASAAAYTEKLGELDAAFQDAVKDAKRKTVVFADRFPFRYLADAYGLTYYAAFPGCATETEPSAATVAFLIDKVRAEGIPAVFHIEMSNEKMADTISEATGAKKLLLHACHNISKADFDGGVTYLSLMTQNAANLKEALN